MAIRNEVKLIGYVLGLYITFIKWGYLQEKLTSSTYVDDFGHSIKWTFPLALNFLMAAASAFIAFIFEFFTVRSRPLPMDLFWKAAVSNAMASPIGYASLRFINFPLMVLTKSSKPVPVMLIGVLFYGRKYTWYKYVSVSLICIGIALFSMAKASHEGDSKDGTKLFIGICMVLLNLLIDGYTNNEQDLVFAKYKATPLQMMKNTNIWQALYLIVFLASMYYLQRDTSELMRAWMLISHSAEVRQDVIQFCLCAAVGQVLIFGLMKEFGSLMWITVSITRKLFTILVSVFMFNHNVNSFQWFGIVCAFAGMGLEVLMSYLPSSKKTASVTEGGSENVVSDTKKTD
jgi:UDP-galactose transporter B1